MFSFVLAMSAAFLGAPAIASDVETGTVHAMLARPLRRSELLLGRWLGLSLVVAAYAILSGLLAIAAVGFVSGHVPPAPQLAVGVPRVPGRRGPHARDRPRDPAPGDRRRLHRRRGVRPRVVRGGARQRRGRPSARAPLPGVGDITRILLPTDGLWRGVVYGLEPPWSCCSPTPATRRRCARTRSSPTRRRRPRSSPGPSPGSMLVLLAGIALFRRREL